MRIPPCVNLYRARANLRLRKSRAQRRIESPVGPVGLGVKGGFGGPRRKRFALPDDRAADLGDARVFARRRPCASSAAP